MIDAVPLDQEGHRAESIPMVQTYPEFCRKWLESGNNQLNFAISDLEAKYKRVRLLSLIHI